MKTFNEIIQKDIEGLLKSDAQYGGSWLKRGGIGAFMMLARKWDRIEQKMTNEPTGSLMMAIKNDQRAEGIIDDIRDLRRYLMLVEAYYIGKDDYIQHLNMLTLSENMFQRPSYSDLKAVWDDLETNCKHCVWDIFQLESLEDGSSYDIKHLRSLLVAVELEFNSLGIDPEHRDNVEKT